MARTRFLRSLFSRELRLYRTEHGRAPNAMLNLTNACTFAEFADEVRVGRRSNVVVMPEYLDQRLREFDVVSDILSSDPALLSERGRWSSRFFITDQIGAVRPLVDAWNGRPPGWIRGLIALFRLMGSAPMRPVVRLALASVGARLVPQVTHN